MHFLSLSHSFYFSLIDRICDVYESSSGCRAAPLSGVVAFYIRCTSAPRNMRARFRVETNRRIDYAFISKPELKDRNMLSQMLSLSDSISVKDDAGERKSKMQKKE